MKLGDRALRFPRPRVDGADAARGAAVLAAARAWPGVVDAWLTEAWLAVEFADDVEPRVEPEALEALEAVRAHDAVPAYDALPALPAVPAVPAYTVLPALPAVPAVPAYTVLPDVATAAGVRSVPVREHSIAVRYDGADLSAIARATGLEEARVVALHVRAQYTVLFLGFLPGFAYLGGLPRELEVARLPSPRARVPPNAVAVGGPYTGVYPFESPGGWRLLGTAVDVRLFEPERGALLRAGDRVRFREVR